MQLILRQIRCLLLIGDNGLFSLEYGSSVPLFYTDRFVIVHNALMGYNGLFSQVIRDTAWSSILSEVVLSMALLVEWSVSFRNVELTLLFELLFLPLILLLLFSLLHLRHKI